MKFRDFISTRFGGLRPGQWLILIGVILQIICALGLVIADFLLSRIHTGGVP